jgi:hypothetical protein
MNRELKLAMNIWVLQISEKTSVPIFHFQFIARRWRAADDFTPNCKSEAVMSPACRKMRRSVYTFCLLMGIMFVSVSFQSHHVSNALNKQVSSKSLANSQVESDTFDFIESTSSTNISAPLAQIYDSSKRIRVANGFDHYFKLSAVTEKPQSLLNFVNDIAATRKISTPRQSADIRLVTEDNFSSRMINAGIPFFTWIDVRMEVGGNLPWVLHTASWWNSSRKPCISLDSLADMSQSPNTYYRTLAKAYSGGEFSKAAKLMSPFPDGVDSWPGVAVFTNAVVYAGGEVHNGSFSVQGKACGEFSPLSFPAHVQQRFEFVATIAHFWGQGYYHFVAENFVRVPLVIPLIEGNPRSKVHVHGTIPFVGSLLELLGIQRGRIVEGTVFADVLLLPEPVPCGNPPAIMLNLLRRTLVERSLQYVISATNGCRILVVKRKGSRAISNHDALVSGLSGAFTACGTTVHTGDESVLNQLHLFRSSTVIVAPHGAGLSNMIACRKETLILELMTTGKDVNICYMAMAFKLFLHYVMLTVPGASHSGPMIIDVNQVLSTLSDETKR